MAQLNQEQVQVLFRAGASRAGVESLDRALQALQLPEQPTRESFETDVSKAEQVYRSGAELLAIWPPKPQRDTAQAQAAERVKGTLRKVRNAFARIYAAPTYRRITRDYARPVRAEDLIYEVAELCPGLCPTRREVALELEVPLAEKEGCEVAQGDFFSHLLGDSQAGHHLMSVMLQPLPRSWHLLEKFRRDGRLDLGTVQVERRGALGCVFFNNLNYLNAEDDGTLLPFETAVDLVLLDPDIQAGLLGGQPCAAPQVQRKADILSGPQPDPSLQGEVAVDVLPDPRPGGGQQA